METFIVYQMQIDSMEINANQGSSASMSNIIRKVVANSKEEAIGKFILETNSIKAFKKLNVECTKLSELKSI